MRYAKMTFENLGNEIESIVIIHDDGSFTWFDHTSESDYAQQYLAWVEEGNVAEEWTGE